MTKGKKRAVRHKKVNKQNIKRRRTSYFLEQKKEVVIYAKEHGRNQAGRYFDIDSSMVGRWVTASTS